MVSVKKLTKGCIALRIFQCALKWSCTVLNEPVPSKRQDWIDISKGFGIVFVVVAHSMIPPMSDVLLESVIFIITSFVMPLFFILAGMTYNSERHRRNLKNYAFSRGRQLLLPYFAIYIIMTLLFIPLTGSIDTYLTPGDLVFWLIYGAGPPGQPTYLWFLPVLYFGLMLFILIEAVTHAQDPRVRWPFVVILPFLALWITDVFSPILVPWRVNSVLFATTFCIIGYEMKRYRGLERWSTESKIRDGVIFIVLSTTFILLSQYNGFVSHPDDWFGKNGWLYLLTGTSGTIAFFMISSLLNPSFFSKRMQFLGVNSQIIYEIHPLFFYLVPILVSLFGFSTTDYESTFTLFWSIRFVIAFGLSIPFTLLILRNRGLSFIFTGYDSK
ncbi:MAG: acyltransferase family protein [Candidatus Thorarchaeota archaeon SMTZ1-45]